MDPSPQTVLSLCSGYEGIGLGLKLADPRFVTACFVEREITAARILVARIKDGILDDAPIWSDLATFDGKPWRGRIHTIAAGYPCQPFSCAGKQRAEKDPRHLWPHVARIVREVQPEQVFLENVDAHLRLGFHEVAEELERMGYRIACGLFSAEEVRAPHRRLRLFALAERTGGRRRELRQSPWLDGLTHGRGAELDHSHREPRRRHEGQAEPYRNESHYRNAGEASPSLEDTARLSEYGQERQDGGRRRGIRQAGDGVADAGNGLVPIAGPGSQGRAGLGPAGAEVAHSGLTRRGRPAQPQGLDRPRASNDDRRTGRAVADTRGGRSPLRSDGQGDEAERAASVRSGIAIFPPGPADLDAWARLLVQRPDVEPAVCRAAYERADRMDGRRQSSRVSRLRALGNGCVPLTVALAYLSLRDALDANSAVMKTVA